MVGAAANGVELLLEVCLKWSCVVRLASMSQPDQPEWFELSSFRRVLMSQSNPPVLFLCIFSFCCLVVSSQEYNLVFFYYINRNILIECCSFK